MHEKSTRTTHWGAVTSSKRFAPLIGLGAKLFDQAGLHELMNGY